MDEKRNNKPDDKDPKDEQLEQYREKNTGPGKKLTSDAGLKISNDRWSLRAGKRGPALFQDFHFYKKQSHFNRERIPEKVVHARGDGAYGEFELYKSMKHVTRAGFLQEPGCKTPVFVRFSNFIGSRGSKDTAIDIRGFATKFYTQEGNYDMLALSFAVFAVADAMKFADFVHAVKPNPITDVPQATVAHDNAWDYIANNQEIAHFIMWLMSSRGRPKSWRMMEAWPVNTFRFINEQGKSTFVRFVWKPMLGVHSLLLDEANIIGGVDPDFHRRDLHDSIKKGAYPEYELGVQLIAEEDEFKYDFDILDDTTLWPEEVVPVEIIGKLTLNRLVDNFFAEEEQSSFDPATVVPGIDFTDDPVLQGRSFAYRDTDYHRLGTGNINNIPVNQPIVETNTNQRQSDVRHRIDVDSVNYHKNSLANNTPAETPPEEGGYAHYPEKVEGHKTRERPGESFFDHFSQPRLFWNSMSPVEKQQIVETFNFHLGYVKSKSVRQQVVEMFANVDKEMATIIAGSIGVNPPTGSNVPVTKSSPALSLTNTPHYAYSQKVAVLIGNGFNGEEVTNALKVLQQYGVFIEIVSEKLGTVVGEDGTKIEVDKIFVSTYPVLYDSIYIVGGSTENEAKFHQSIMNFLNEAYKHYKPIGIASTGQSYIKKSPNNNLAGVVFAANNPDFGKDFVSAIAKQRFWDRK
ncbi:catalase HPII [Virgibacillus profundi]|uniref:Catalase n=1 Tax=Virgibacillus profundi TaxID=2024555 RepID=A0A2A2I9Q2_9BACI|nr:catalase [Virgibacillus profundi]PAV27865.1 catalase HPII [Virgibacillus profundi]PXY52043.1 catalase [Virgibacillus profundi]